MYRSSAFILLLITISSAVPFISQQPGELAEREINGFHDSGKLLAVENGRVIDMSWLNDIPTNQRVQIDIPGLISKGKLVHPAPPGSTTGDVKGSSGSATRTTGSSNSSPTASSSSASAPGSSSPPLNTPIASLTSSKISVPAVISSSARYSSTKTPMNIGGGTNTTSSAGACPLNMKGVTFNGGFNPGMFDTIDAATNWITFSLDGAKGGSAKAQAAYIPMMAFASDVPRAIAMVTGPNPPAWMLTFNEPDFSYGSVTPTMNPQEAATAIGPLLKTKTTTKFVAPVTADPASDWLNEFYSACQCKTFFSAYNIHIYNPSSQHVADTLTAFHHKYPEKLIWLTEIAPGSATPACSLGWDTVTTFMNDVYRFAATSGFMDRVFWNSGNEIGSQDQNVCNSYLLDVAGKPSPLLEHYKAVGCS